MALREIYRRNYRQQEGYTSYNELSAHVTVDTAEKLASVEACQEGISVALTATLKKLGEKAVVAEVTYNK